MTVTFFSGFAAVQARRVPPSVTGCSHASAAAGLEAKMLLGRLRSLSAHRACQYKPLLERASGAGCELSTAGKQRQGAASFTNGSHDPGACILDSAPGLCTDNGARVHYLQITNDTGAWKLGNISLCTGCRLRAKLHYHSVNNGSYDTGAWRLDSSPVQYPGNELSVNYQYGTNDTWVRRLDSTPCISSSFRTELHFFPVTNGNHDPGACILDSSSDQCPGNGLISRHHYFPVTNGSHDTGTWKLGNTSGLYTGNRCRARRHCLPVTIGNSSLCRSNGLGAKLHYHSVTSGSRDPGAMGLGNTYGQCTDGELGAKLHYLPGAQKYVRSFRAVISQEQGPALLHNPKNPLTREGSLGTFSMSQTEGKCWNCHNHVRINVFFCPSCSAIQPPDPTKDYFQILDSDRSFTINVQKLQETYRNLQRLLHPDYFSQKSQKERDLSEIQSSLVNKAYRTLLTPLSRGLYLLKLNGIKLGQGTDSDIDMPFILEIMEINEKLEEARDETEVQDIGNFVEAKYEELTEDVSKAFDKGDVQEAKLLLIKMKYFSNIQEKVKTKNMPS